MKYSVVIVTYNRLNLLKKCIECVENQSLQASHIIVVNNCSNDGTKEYLDSIKSEQIIILNSKENVGGAGGFALGVEKCLDYYDDWIVLIDDDAMLQVDFLEKINYAAKKNPDILSYSGTVKVKDRIDISHRIRMKSWTTYTDYTIPIKEYEEKNEFFCDTASFCGLVVNKNIVEKIGIPNKDFFIWFDDTEYSLRIRKHTKILNINSAVVNHESIFLSDNKINWKTYYGIRNRMFIVKNYFGTIAFIVNMSKLIAKYSISSLRYYCKKSDENLYVKNLFRDSLYDIACGKMGKNIKYIPR
jgi:rhamnopyranosyl-N-acetylglucosaminyl-diphospho-decaprenol beta-1,3/1,4-galactofuranosyltransferase